MCLCMCVYRALCSLKHTPSCVSCPPSPTRCSCGTHLLNTSQLQLIVFLPGLEMLRGAKTVRLHFVVGERALAMFQHAMQVHAKLTKELAVGADQFEAVVRRLLVDARQLAKVNATLWKERAPEIARELSGRLVAVDAAIKRMLLHWHHDLVPAAALMTIAGAVQTAMTATATTAATTTTATTTTDGTSPALPPPPSYLLILTGGSPKEGGPAVIVGTADYLDTLAPHVTQILDLKGSLNAKLARWQGKSNQPQWPSANTKKLAQWMAQQEATSAAPQ